VNNIDSLIELWTRDLHDAHFDPKIACDYCDNVFRENDAYSSEYNTTLSFCSEDCLIEWEQEQKEYELQGD
jgi:hypothetical protein